MYCIRMSFARTKEMTSCPFLWFWGTNQPFDSKVLLLVALRSCSEGRLRDAWIELRSVRCIAQDGARRGLETSVAGVVHVPDWPCVPSCPEHVFRSRF